MPNSSLFEIAAVHADWVSARQSAVASNIANAKVPGYRPIDTISFLDHLARSESDSAGGSKSGMPILVELDGRVSIEKELMHSSEVRSAYSLNAAAVSAFHTMFMLVTKG